MPVVTALVQLAQEISEHQLTLRAIDREPWRADLSQTVLERAPAAERTAEPPHVEMAVVPGLRPSAAGAS